MPEAALQVELAGQGSGVPKPLPSARQLATPLFTQALVAAIAHRRRAEAGWIANQTGGALEHGIALNAVTGRRVTQHKGWRARVVRAAADATSLRNAFLPCGAISVDGAVNAASPRRVARSAIGTIRRGRAGVVRDALVRCAIVTSTGRRANSAVCRLDTLHTGARGRVADRLTIRRIHAIKTRLAIRPRRAAGRHASGIGATGRAPAGIRQSALAAGGRVASNIGATRSNRLTSGSEVATVIGTTKAVGRSALADAARSIGRSIDCASTLTRRRSRPTRANRSTLVGRCAAGDRSFPCALMGIAVRAGLTDNQCQAAD